MKQFVSVIAEVQNGKDNLLLMLLSSSVFLRTGLLTTTTVFFYGFNEMIARGLGRSR